jgi:hypothetical protein
LDGVGGFGKEGPENVEIVGRYRVELEAELDARFTTPLDEQMCFRCQSVTRCDLNEDRG